MSKRNFYFEKEGVQGSAIFSRVGRYKSRGLQLFWQFYSLKLLWILEAKSRPEHIIIGLEWGITIPFDCSFLLTFSTPN
jgi:hypothetical protein